MAGQLTIDTLKASSGVLATQNGMTGVCKAWVNFNASSGSAVIRSSFNVSSVTVNGTGDYTVTYTTTMPDANYAVSVSGQYTSTGNNSNTPICGVSGANIQSPTTSIVRIGTSTDAAIATAPTGCYVVIHGN